MVRKTFGRFANAVEFSTMPTMRSLREAISTSSAIEDYAKAIYALELRGCDPVSTTAYGSSRLYPV